MIDKLNIKKTCYSTYMYLKQSISLNLHFGLTGALFSGLSAVETFSSMLSNTMYTQLYNETVGYSKGFVFLVMAGLCFVIGAQFG